jgi:hypothetical protein
MIKKYPGMLILFVNYQMLCNYPMDHIEDDCILAPFRIRNLVSSYIPKNYKGDKLYNEKLTQVSSVSLSLNKSLIFM